MLRVYPKGYKHLDALILKGTIWELCKNSKNIQEELLFISCWSFLLQTVLFLLKSCFQLTDNPKFAGELILPILQIVPQSCLYFTDNPGMFGGSSGGGEPRSRVGGWMDAEYVDRVVSNGARPSSFLS